MSIEISVIIPTYQPHDYLNKCIASIAHQTMDKKLFEVIIVLNGCDEPYHQQIKTWLLQYPELQSQVLQTDVPGVSNARNIGLEHAQGNNICFIDDDDWVSPRYLEALLLAKASDNCITVSNVQNYDEKRDQYHDDYITTSYNKFASKGKAPLLQGRSFLSSSCCKLIPRPLIGSRRFDTSFTFGEDSLFMAAITKHLDEILLANDDAVYYRRERSGSASRSNQSLSSAFRILVKSWKAYIQIYLSDISHYNLLFFLTRLAGVFVTQTDNLKKS